MVKLQVHVPPLPPRAREKPAWAAAAVMAVSAAAVGAEGSRRREGQLLVVL
jgi:hypothetical protein